MHRWMDRPNSTRSVRSTLLEPSYDSLVSNTDTSSSTKPGQYHPSPRVPLPVSRGNTSVVKRPEPFIESKHWKSWLLGRNADVKAGFSAFPSCWTGGQSCVEVLREVLRVGLADWFLPATDVTVSRWSSHVIPHWLPVVQGHLHSHGWPSSQSRD
jgi:hypothetical protein